MYRISKRMEIAGAHKLNLPYESPCCNLHGHNWIVTVYCGARRLNGSGMIVDFAKVKKAIHGWLDHSYINDKLAEEHNVETNPTAENMACIISQKVSELCETGICYRVDVQESEGNVATYENEDWEEFV